MLSSCKHVHVFLQTHAHICFVFVALRPKSTAMVMADVQFTYQHIFLDKLEQAVNQYFVLILSLVTDNKPS